MVGLFVDTTRQARLTAGTPGGDQRKDERHRLVLQVAKLVTPHGEELCILRNVSAGGLQAIVYSPLKIDDRVRLELRTGRGVSGRVVWTKGSAIGVAFDRKVPILAYLAHQAIEEMGRHARPPRVRIGQHGILRSGRRAFPVTIADASQTGMRVSTDHVLAPGEPCDVMADGLGDRPAQVRWCKDGEIGLQLQQPLGFRDFAKWRRRKARPIALN